MAYPAPHTFDLRLPAPAAPERDLPGARALRRILTDLAERYPEVLRAEQRQDVPRIGFHLRTVLQHCPSGSVADLGGGLGLFPPGAAALGLRVWLVDDFGDGVNSRHPLDTIGLHRELGVQVVERPVREWGDAFAAESLDVVTSFDSLEHWHHSPRPVLAHALRALKPGGLLLLGAPNAVNLRKRIAVPLGRSNWSRFEDWYYPDEFRGHVREPTLGELVRMAEESGFRTQATWGRNWAGLEGRRGLRRGAVALLDRALRPLPTLCSDLYVLARKPDA